MTDPVFGPAPQQAADPELVQLLTPEGERVLVEQLTTSCSRRPGCCGCGTRTQHTNSALPMSHAATRATISSTC